MFKGKNFVGSLIFLIISFIGLFHGYRLSLGTLSAPGSGFFPFYLSIILVFLSVALLLKSLKMKVIEKKELISIGSRWGKLLMGLAVLASYAYALKSLGFLICSFLLLIFLLRSIEGRSWKSTFIISLISMIVSYFVFAKYLGVPLPKGIIPY